MSIFTDRLEGSTVDDVIDLGSTWRLLRHTRVALAAEVAAAAGMERLDPGDLDTLDQVASTEGPQPMSAIADGLAVDRSTATRAVDRLARRGLVERNRDRSGARLVRVSLTADGASVHRHARERRAAFTGRLLERLSDHDRKALTRLARGLATVTDEFALGSDERPQDTSDEAHPASATG
ncbi:MAG: MarR family winged helix-turn-helix transcriptional regulator [Acidimicrobiales bacterium]